MSERMTFSSADDFVQMESALRDAAGAVYATLGRVDNVGGWHSDAGWEGPAADARASLGAAHDQLATIAAQYEALAQDVHSRIPLAEAVSGTVAERGRSTGVGTTSSGGGISASLHDGHQSTQGSDNPLAGVAGFFGGVTSAVGGAAHGVADATGSAVHNTLDAAGGAIHGVADATGSAVHDTLGATGQAISTVDHGATVAVVGGAAEATGHLGNSAAEATGRLGNSVVQAGGDLLGSTGRAVDDFGKRWKANDPAGAVGTALNDVTGGVSTGLQHIEGGAGSAAKALVHGGAMGAIDAAGIVGMQGRVAPVVSAGERAVDRVVDNEVRFSQGVTKALGGVVTGLVDVGVWAYHSSPSTPQDPKIWERQTLENFQAASTIAHDPPKAASLLGQALIVKPIQDVLSGDPERMGEGATNLALTIVSFTKVAALARVASVAIVAKVSKLDAIGVATNATRRIADKAVDALNSAPLGQLRLGRLPDSPSIPVNDLIAGKPVYGDLDNYGRATGVVAKITRDVLRTGSEPGVDPRGYVSGRGFARGHLLAAVLGGSGKTVKNLVPLYQSLTNSPIMRDFELKVRDAVDAGETVYYRVTPIYRGGARIPKAVEIEAVGDRGFHLHVGISNARYPTISELNP